jgi:hypothetical protein
VGLFAAIAVLETVKPQVSFDPEMVRAQIDTLRADLTAA